MARHRPQDGLVLSELIIVLIIAGLLVASLGVQLRGATHTRAQALALYDTTQKMAANWNRIASSCGVQSTVQAQPLLVSGSAKVDSVFTQGEQVINSRFLNCYRQSDVRLLTDAIQLTSNGAQIQHYNFTLSGGGFAPFIAQFPALPAELAYILASRYGGLNGASLLSQDLTNPRIRYWPDSPNSYTVQILIGSPTQLAAAPGIIGTRPGSPVPPPPAPAPPSAPFAAGPPSTLPPPASVTPSPYQPPAPPLAAAPPASSNPPATSSPPASSNPPASSTPPATATPPTTDAVAYDNPICIHGWNTSGWDNGNQCWLAGSMPADAPTVSPPALTCIFGCGNPVSISPATCAGQPGWSFSMSDSSSTGDVTDYWNFCTSAQRLYADQTSALAAATLAPMTPSQAINQCQADYSGLFGSNFNYSGWQFYVSQYATPVYQVGPYWAATVTYTVVDMYAIQPDSVYDGPCVYSTEDVKQQ